MSSYDDDEKVEALKRWWKKYGTSVILGVVLGLGIMYGWQFWQKHQYVKHSQASIAYQSILENLAAKNQKQAEKEATRLVQDSPKSTYATIASLILAKQAVDAGKYDKAKQHLQWVLDHGKVDAYRQVARIRLARVMAAQKQTDNALQLLKTVDDKAFTALIAEVKGDILLTQGKQQQAKQAYKTALDAIPAQSPMRATVLMKFNSLSSTLERGGIA